MSKINLYVSDADEPVMERLRKKLEKEHRSMSEFLIEAAKDHLNAETEPGEIELHGQAQKRKFKGNTLYRRENANGELGVFLTAKGAIAYWAYCPDAFKPGDREIFAVYASLDEFFARNSWFGDRNGRHIKAEVELAYAELTNRRRVEELDI